MKKNYYVVESVASPCFGAHRYCLKVSRNFPSKREANYVKRTLERACRKNKAVSFWIYFEWVAQ